MTTGHDRLHRSDIGLVRLRVTDPSEPPCSRVFDLPRGAPLDWLRRAFLLATGRAAEPDVDDWLYEVRDVVGPGGGRGLLSEAPVGADRPELVLAFGRVEPSVERSGVLTGPGGLPPGSPLVTLLRRLTPLGRLALRAHLDDTGLLSRPHLDQDDALSLTEGIRLAHSVLRSDSRGLVAPSESRPPDATIFTSSAG